mgnify:CR=1 FL=1
MSDHHLYIFAGFPGKAAPPGLYLNAGGLQHAIENVLYLAQLGHGAICATKDGLLSMGLAGGFETLEPVKYHLSDLLVISGITWDWFPEHYSFGNGISIPKSSASWETQVVVHERGCTLEELFREGEVVDLSQLRLQRVHKETEGWATYEKRWLAGTCPHYTHIVHMTHLLTTHELSPSAYKHIQMMIEDPRVEIRPEPPFEARHFSEVRRYDGRPAYSLSTRSAL